MKKLLSLAVVLGATTVSALASANVAKVDVFVGRMLSADSCFVQVDLKTVEQNMFNGQEKLSVGAEQLGSFAGLLSGGKSLSAGKSVLFASPAFVSEVGLAADVPITNAQCAQLKPSARVEFTGSFALAGFLDLPADYKELDLVGALLRLDLSKNDYRVKSLDGEKTIGGAAGGGAGGTSSSGGTTSSSGGTTSGSSGEPPPSSSSSNDSCSVAAPGATGGSGLALVALGAALASSRRRRGTKQR